MSLRGIAPIKTFESPGKTMALYEDRWVLNLISTSATTLHSTILPSTI